MITSAQYSSIICALELADSCQNSAKNELISMKSNLANTRTTVQKKTALTSEIDHLNQYLSYELSTPLPQLIETVRRLQLHVSTYAVSVDSFLSNNSLQVSPYFASLSELAGYPIAEENVGNSCL